MNSIKRPQGILLALEFLAVAALVIFLMTPFDLKLLFENTTPTGGDVPAHNYLVSHLRDSLKKSFSIVSWAQGFWCGFPMFQYYFFLPYLVAVLLGLIIPLNIAFKLVSIAGFFLLPIFVFFGVRQSDAPEPAPLACAVASVPFLLADTHVMWGVNLASTLAGMISNSWSFCIFVLVLGMVLSDLEANRFRLTSVFAIFLLFASHFFTTLIAALVLGITLAFFGRHIRTKLIYYIIPFSLAAGLVAFWLVPLFLKNSWSVEFGGDWEEKLLKTFPKYAPYLAPLALWAMIEGAIKRVRFIGMMAVMLVLSSIMWFVGGRINASFCNIRFWPFIFYAYLILAGCGVSFILSKFPFNKIALIGIAAIVCYFIMPKMQPFTGWFKWNNEGMEHKRAYPALKKLIDEVKGTPGRLSNDLCTGNKRFGSDRIFESMPTVAKKPIIEGGIVNSATGSMFSYILQCEMSDNCAGFPKIVNPPPQDPEIAQLHLDLFSVSHVAACSKRLQNALDESPNWEPVFQTGVHKLFKRKGGPRPNIFIPAYKPIAVRTAKWKERAIEWFSMPALLSKPVVFVKSNESNPPGIPLITEKQFFGLVVENRPDKTEIPAWSLIGPFYHEHDLKNPIQFLPKGIEEDDESELNPANPITIQGKKWFPAIRRSAFFVDGLFNPSHDFVIYCYASLFSDQSVKAKLLAGHDDGARILLNGRKIFEGDYVIGWKDMKPYNVTLQRGRNDLVFKLQQGTGGAFLRAAIVDELGNPVEGLKFGLDRNGPLTEPSQLMQPVSKECNIEVKNFGDDQIAFTTNCIGEPHIINVSYFPNWKAKGAKGPYHVSPNFILVYPTESKVTVYYGSTSSDILGRVISSLSLLAIIAIIVWRKVYRKGKEGDQTS